MHVLMLAGKHLLARSPGWWLRLLHDLWPSPGLLVLGLGVCCCMLIVEVITVKL